MGNKVKFLDKNVMIFLWCQKHGPKVLIFFLYVFS